MTKPTGTLIDRFVADTLYLANHLVWLEGWEAEQQLPNHMRIPREPGTPDDDVTEAELYLCERADPPVMGTWGDWTIRGLSQTSEYLYERHGLDDEEDDHLGAIQSARFVLTQLSDLIDWDAVHRILAERLVEDFALK